ncbi:DEKNAAC103946 [Brettanomyces naardenensis]|uniref:GTP-binding protein n=1 Tax=Brettanomyces naardenensis TaxID=13370 RepID=A0A448YPS1_BRENA|nr:DEKNAAC103946 [Brettanomyces naardenensis]
MDYTDNSLDQSRATILLMGLRRSGKSSICKVVFHNVQPLDTLYLESTTKPTTENFQSLIDLAVVELPGQLNLFEPSLYDSEKLFSSIGALVYVIDSQDEYLSALQNLAVIIKYAVSIKPKIHIEVLIHKIDGLSEDFRLDTQRDIMQRVGDDLLDYGLEGVQISFYLTSIFDHSIYEAFSRIVQKLIYELPALENLLDLLMQYSSFDKVFLFDINSKIYVATDSSPVDIQTYEVCAEFIDVTIDLDGLYETKGGKGMRPTRCVSKLQNGVTLYLYQMIRGLALVGVSRLDDGEDATSMSVIDYNVAIFKRSLEKMWEKSKNLEQGNL